MTNPEPTPFHKLDLVARLKLVYDWLKQQSTKTQIALSGGLDTQDAIQAYGGNIIGVISLPLGLIPGVLVNGQRRRIPLAIEEPGVISGTRFGCDLISRFGGFMAEADDPATIIGLVEIRGLQNQSLEMEARIKENAENILAAANQSIPNMVARGGGAKSLDVIIAPNSIVVRIHVDCRDAMGANIATLAAESAAPALAELTGGTPGLRILSNHSPNRKVRIRCSLPPEALAFQDFEGERVAHEFVAATNLAYAVEERACTHNKGILNAVDAVLVATGNDWRAVEAGAYTFATDGGYAKPLCTWKLNSLNGVDGFLEMPLAVGIVGGATRFHAGVRTARALANPTSAADLAILAGVAGMGAHFTSLLYLCTVGIMAGHGKQQAKLVFAQAKVPERDFPAAMAQAAAGRYLPAILHEIVRTYGKRLQEPSDAHRALESKRCASLRSNRLLTPCRFFDT